MSPRYRNYVYGDILIPKAVAPSLRAHPRTNLNPVAIITTSAIDEFNRGVITDAIAVEQFEIMKIIMLLKKDKLKDK